MIEVGSRVLRIITFVAAGAVAAGCAAESTGSVRTEAGGAGTTLVAQDLRTLAASAELVVIGTVRSGGGTRNIARDPSDRTKSSSAYTVEAQDFTLEVEETVRGTAASAVVVSLVKARGPSGWPLTAVEGYEPFKIGGRYLLFLVRIPGTSAFGQTPEPFRFELTSSARAVTLNAEVQRRFPARPTNEFLNEVRAAAR